MNGLNKLFFSIYIEKIKNRGEDSEPLISIGDTSILLGVFDGLGGAGSIQKYKIDREDDYKSGAYVASRATSNTVKWFFNYYNLHRFLELELNKKKFNILDPFSLKTEKPNIKIIERSIDGFLNYLEKKLIEELTNKENLYADKARVSKLKSKSVNLLPSTMSLLYTTCIEGKKIIFSFWAGDSRAYKLDATGLVQLTSDDIDEVDNSLDSINSNAPMNNYINISKKFHINHNFFIEDETKQILISSTDGAFGVFETPIEFELAILNTLQESNSVEMWKSKLESILKKRQNDDISIVLYPVGFEDFEDIKNFYKNRSRFLNNRTTKHVHIESDIKILKKQIDALENILNNKRAELEDIIVEEWNSYSIHYLKQIRHYFKDKRRE